MSSSLIPEADPFIGFSACRQTPETPTPYFTPNARNPFHTSITLQLTPVASPSTIVPPLIPPAFEDPENLLRNTMPEDQTATLAQAIAMLANTLSHPQPSQTKPAHTKV